ncbi:hypothetical protein GCM10020221_30100 [Streptomyces thioluteus]|uniref:Uncharacterized protein n=1 Tax=Streptomyces thioluteus TaxID=66431 RepID=A0ABP6JJU6_STRTU
MRAPEQAVKANDVGACAAAHRAGYALELRLQSPPWYEPAPTPEE